MTEYGTIRIPKDVYDRANDVRKENGETWAEFIGRAIDAEPTVEMSESDVQQLVQEKVEELVVEQALR